MTPEEKQTIIQVRDDLTKWAMTLSTRTPKRLKLSDVDELAKRVQPLYDLANKLESE